ncbi:MAG: flagellar M-ring protein FliF [Gammaproteobacteria bacterium]|nr:flagellar M-ring protein FliF [Gammaproteobacteria bacterium]
MATPNPISLLNSIPGLRQLIMLVGVAGAVAAGIAVFLWARGEDYQILYSGLAEQNAVEVAQALNTAGIPNKIDLGAGAVRVPAARIHEARLQLASQGLPQGGEVGLEMLREDQGMGVSSFIENARYQHALEGELGRTVASLRPVKSARVHLAIPRATAFARDRLPTSASVLVELYPGRTLERGQVASIVHLVASSIPELQPANVTVIDQQGQLLSENDDGSELAQVEKQFDKKRGIEQSYAKRIEQLLLPLTGPGRVSTQVHADLDFTQTEEVREAYEPDPQAIRSEQLAEQTQSGAQPALGVPGATSNQPPNAGGSTPPAQAANRPGAQNTNQSRQSTRNYELDKTISHTRQQPFRIRRVNVAVLVDYLPKPNADGEAVPTALTADELARIEALVKEAVGFDAARGDSVNVMNAPFAPPAEVEEPEETPFWKQPLALDIARNAFGALVLALIAFTILRPALRNLTRVPAPLVATAGPAALADLRDDTATIAAGGAMVPAAPPTQRAQVLGFDQKLQVAKAAVAQDPKKVAQVVKNWVGE